MDEDKLIEQLEEAVREAEELLQRRKRALAELKGKSVTSKRGSKVRGLRPGSMPALALAALKSARQPITLDELTAHLKKNIATVDSRKVSIGLSRYVREGHYFVVEDDGKYRAK
jgi:hypothetical protein